MIQLRSLFLSLLTFVITVNIVFAQNLELKTGSVALDENGSELAAISGLAQQSMFDGKAFVLAQFYGIPTIEQKTNLEELGLVTKLH